ncbi:MAG TPA: TRAP transporter substrate-binding protein DctP, partial [Smithellaceae bacterium]|nr:TRAP transporter substrate-binding protein DctP [Smithellaceae bacterium]
PRISAFDLPFIFKNAVQNTEILYDVYEQYLADDFKDYKVLWLYSCDTGQLHSVTKPIRKIEDLQGMKMRTPSSYMSEALRLLGVNPLSMPLSELAVSLDKHVIDGMLTPNTAIVDFKLANTIKYSAQIDFYVSPMAVIMNKEKFNALPDSAKKALEQAGGKKWGLRAAKLYDDYAQTTLRELGDSGKVKIFNLSAADRKKCIEKVKKMEADWVAKNTAKGIPAEELLTKIKTLTAQK